MTPKEKAKELHSRFMKPVDDLHKYPMCFDTAKQCALICVETILIDVGAEDFEDDELTNSNYWEEVKKEIEKL